MATRTQSRTSNRNTNGSSGNANKSTSEGRSEGQTRTRTSSESRGRSREEKSAFSFGNGNTGAIVGATLAGVAIGVAANFGRKFLMQGMEATVGDWDAILATEHDAALAIFDKML